MRIEFIAQPDAANSNLFEFASRILHDSGIAKFVAVSAWVNHRGLARLVPALRAFRRRTPTPGFAQIVLGIDEGGATQQGLRLAADEFDEAWVFSTSDERTFHPKVYFGLGPEKAYLLVGSNNLTPGGLFFNFEAALALELRLGSGAPPEDEALVGAITDYVRRLTTDSGASRPLVPNLDAIIRDPSFGVRDEAQPRRRGLRAIDPDADRDEGPFTTIFGRSAVPAKPIVPPGLPIPLSPPTGGRHLRARPGATPRARAVRRRVGAVVPPPAIPNRRWFREFDATAAQHPPGPKSSPTGSLRLTQGGHGVDQTTYFRNEMFGALPWVGVAVPRGTRERAEVNLEVIIDGRSLGIRRFPLSHAAWREAGQGNVPTVLHLTPISAELRDTNYTGRVVTIESWASGAFRLSIDTAETGAFRR